jgi:hypothetical protein
MVESPSYVLLAIALIQAALKAANVNGVATEVIANLEDALNALVKVHGSDVTFTQLEQLRVK